MELNQRRRGKTREAYLAFVSVTSVERRCTSQYRPAAAPLLRPSTPTSGSTCTRLHRRRRLLTSRLMRGENVYLRSSVQSRSETRGNLQSKPITKYGRVEAPRQRSPSPKRGKGVGR